MNAYGVGPLPLYWPHVFFVALTAWGCVRAKNVWTALAIAAVCAVAVAGLYLILGNGVAPPRPIAIPGRLLAMLAAGAVPMAVVAVLARGFIARGAGAGTAAVVSAVAGLLSIPLVPIVQIALTCWFTGLCL